MSGGVPSLLRGLRRGMAKLPGLGMARVPDAPAQPVRDPWPGDPSRGAALMKGEFELAGGTASLRLGGFASLNAPPLLMAALHGFVWLRDLRALGTMGRGCAPARWWRNGLPPVPLCCRLPSARM